MAGKHNQKRHANRFHSRQAIKESFRRLKDDKAGRERLKQTARKRIAKQQTGDISDNKILGFGDKAKSRNLKDMALEDLSRDELMSLRSRIDGLLGESPELNAKIAAERPNWNKGHVVTATGTDPTKKFEMQYELRELDDLVVSNTETGTINPNFPKELQPRDRSRAASRAQVDNIAQNLEPDALLDEFKAIDRGTPIIGKDNVVESGNGRSMALRKAKDQYPDQYANYKARLKQKAEERGIDPSAIDNLDNPVLVRVRTDNTGRVDFAKAANEASSLGVSASERARTDASRIKTEQLVNLQQSGDIDKTLRSRQNRDFVRSFVADIPANERAEMMTKAGDLTQSGENRIKGALFNRVYDSPELSGRIFESTDNDVRNITNGMLNSLGEVGRAEELVRTGQRAKDLSISQDITKAVQTYVGLKDQGMSVDDYLAQGQLFGRQTTKTQERIMKELDNRRRSGKKVKSFFDTWGRVIDEQPHPGQLGLFGGSGGASKDELVTRWISLSQQDELQIGLF